MDRIFAPSGIVLARSVPTKSLNEAEVEPTVTVWQYTLSIIVDLVDEDPKGIPEMVA